MTGPAGLVYRSGLSRLASVDLDAFCFEDRHRRVCVGSALSSSTASRADLLPAFRCGREITSFSGVLTETGSTVTGIVLLASRYFDCLFDDLTPSSVLLGMGVGMDVAGVDGGGQVAGGSPHRFQTLGAAFVEQRLSLVRLAMILVDDRETAEDVVQDVFAKLARRSGGAEASAPTPQYLRASVLNTARSVLRRRKLMRLRTAPTTDEHDRETVAATTRLSDESAILQQLDRLPRRQREVLVLRYFQDLSSSEIAATLGISVSAVSSSESVALKKLNRYLKETS